MNRAYNIYITSSESIGKSEWMSVLLKNLKMALTRTSDVSLNFKVRNYDNENWIENIEQSDVFITLLDGNKNESETDKYLNELYAISDQIQKNGQFSNFNNVYKIFLAPDKDIKQPALFKQLKSYNFYENSGRREITSKFEFSKKDQKAKAWNLLIDLAFDLRDSINEIDNIIPVDQQEENNAIYLTRSSTDLSDIRNEIKRELQQLGYSILPESDTIDIFNNENTIIDYLNRCCFIVQIMGEKYGEVIKGDRVSLFEKESTIINRAINDNSSIQRLIWIPNSLKRKEPRQELFISRIKQKESTDKTKIIECSIDEFKDILTQNFVRNKKLDALSSNSSDVYLITTPETNHDNLLIIAKDLNLNLNTINLSNEVNLYHQHIELLSKNNNILIYWVNGDQFWLKSKLSDLVKAPGLGKKTPYNSIGIIVNGESPDISAYSNWLPNIHLIQHDSKEELEKFFQGIIE